MDPATNKSIERSAEFNRLLVEQGRAIQDMKYRQKNITPEEREATDARANRLVELADLLHMTYNASGTGELTPERYVNDRLAAWLRANPLPLSMERVARTLTDDYRLYSLKGGVQVQIGDLANGGYQYRVMDDDFAWSGARVEGEGDTEVVMGDMVLRIPESVAEHFRQQGRRRAQRDMQHALGL